MATSIMTTMLPLIFVAIQLSLFGLVIYWLWKTKQNSDKIVQLLEKQGK